MQNWNIKKITRRIEGYGTSVSSKIFNNEGSLLRDVTHEITPDGKNKIVNYSRRNFIFWTYEREERFGKDSDRKHTIEIRNRKKEKLLCWIDTNLGTDFEIYKKGKKRYSYSKSTIFEDDESSIIGVKGKVLITKTVYIYNSKNQIVKEICTNLKTRKLYSETLYEYNENNDCIYSYKKSVDFITTNSYLYNERNQLLRTSEIVVNKSQNKNWQIDEIFSYDNLGRLIKKTEYEDSSIRYEETMEYDDSNNIIKKTEFFSCLGYNERVYKYKNNLCIETEIIGSDSIICNDPKAEYKYDNSGNKTQKIVYYRNGNSKVTNFDKFGNKISVVTYDAKSEIVNSEIIFRDINGIEYLAYFQDKKYVVRKNTEGMPIEIIELEPPNELPDAYKEFIDYEYFK